MSEFHIPIRMYVCMYVYSYVHLYMYCIAHMIYMYDLPARIYI
jgi:hypothetical protein